MRYAMPLLFLISACGAENDSTTDVGTEALDTGSPAARFFLRRGEAPSSGGASSLIDHGGRVLPSSNTYAIWWGAPSAFPSDARPGLDALFAALSGTPYLGIAGQYLRSAAIESAFHANYVDTSAPPRHAPSVGAIVNEACRTINANGLTADPGAVYFVYTSNFPHVNYCAWHSYGSCNGVTIQVAFMPNTTNVAGCDPLGVVDLGCYGASASEGLISLANVTAHELMEAITDADLSAWYDSSGEEIADKCAWKFSSCVTLAGNTSWQLQQEWSNAARGCAQQ
jgi:hypothetical protein